MIQILKYPRTQHIEGSRLQEGDQDLSQVPFKVIKNRQIVVEEKMDGANSGVSFSDDGELLLQSRGHYLNGGPRERHFALFKTWANTFTEPLFEILTDRYIMYGEWMFAKHTVFYTDLPHYFLEFDIYDKEEKIFLSTAERQKLLKNAPFVVPVKVLHDGKLSRLADLKKLITPSFFIAENATEILQKICNSKKLRSEQVLMETDLSGLMEGLYIKVEENGRVVERYKWVRHDFLQTALSSGSHWHDRPIIPNQLQGNLEDLFIAL